jgi:hypothetical protein
MVAAAVVVVLITLPSFAQSRRAGFKVRVPFQFFVAETLLSPGEYIIQRIGGHGDAFVFRTADLHPVQMQLVSARDTAGKILASKLVFHRYGSEYYLAEVWSAGEDRAAQCAEGKREIKLAERRSPGLVSVALPMTGK